MLDEKDLELIGVEMGKMFEQNIMPQFESIHKDIKEMKGEMGVMKADIISIKATMVTKSYLDDKIADLKGEFIANDRKLEKKTDVLVDTLVERRTLTASDVEKLERARVFPRIAH